jgi:glycosyltransferase involved in cell wall biosynthesis
MKVAVAAGGRFHAFHLAHQLERYDVLQGLYTASYTGGDESYVPEQKIFYNKTVGILDRVYQSFGGRYVMSPSSWYVMKDGWFDAWLGQQFEHAQGIDIVVGWAHYIGGSMPILKKMGAKVVLESGSMHILAQQKILEHEADRWGASHKPIQDENRDKILQEYEAADFISVPSYHAKQSFVDFGIPSPKILVTPYGVDYESFYVSRMEQPKKFQVLFVGMISLQKGIGYLLEAWKKLNLPEHLAELVIVGSQLDFPGELSVAPSVKYVGPLRQSELREWYASSSLLVLPSVQEGMAMVQAEALAAGVPVLCTDRTGGQDLFEDGIHGMVVSSGDSDILAEKIGWAFAHQEDLFKMGLAGQQHIKKHTWNAYGKKIVKQYDRVMAR